MKTASCPYCSHALLHHVSGYQSYWFCSRCRQKVSYPSEICDSCGKHKCQSRSTTHLKAHKQQNYDRERGLKR